MLEEPKTAKTTIIQQNIDHVIQIMNSNISKAMARGESLQQLEHQVNDLQTITRGFMAEASTTSQNLWFKNKMASFWFLGSFSTLLITGGIVLFVFKLM
jgi:hypothetical protein